LKELFLEEHRRFGWGILLVDRNFLKAHIKNGWKILDVGCNVNFLCKTIKEWYPNCECWGIDIIEYPNTWKENFKVFDGVHIPFDNGYFDLVTSIHTFEHVENLIPLLYEIWRVLKSDGKIYVETIDKNSESFKIDKTHKIGFKPDTIKDYLSSFFKDLAIWLIGDVICCWGVKRID